MEYYDCKNNILEEINKQGILTSGYMSHQFDGNGQPVTKPTNVDKCSHGSVMDKTAENPAIGGINKDSMTPVYSPHYYLQSVDDCFLIVIEKFVLSSIVLMQRICRLAQRNDFSMIYVEI